MVPCWCSRPLLSCHPDTPFSHSIMSWKRWATFPDESRVFWWLSWYCILLVFKCSLAFIYLFIYLVIYFLEKLRSSSQAKINWTLSCYASTRTWGEMVLCECVNMVLSAFRLLGLILSVACNSLGTSTKEISSVLKWTVSSRPQEPLTEVSTYNCAPVLLLLCGRNTSAHYWHHKQIKRLTKVNILTL